MTKTDITASLKNLEKHGFKVYTFNSNKPMPKGLRGLPDHLIIGNMYQWWLEVKIGKDTEKPDQKTFREMIEKFERKNKVVKYRQVNENNLAEIIQEIYGK